MLKEGLSYTSTTIVDNTNTAPSLGSGDLNVFATPAMVALMENAAMKAVESYLQEGASTVGAEIKTTHVKPSKIGDTIQAIATLEKIENRKLTFTVTAKDSAGTIGEGTHIRFVVDREKFLSRL